MPSVPSVRSPRGPTCVGVAGTGPCTLGLGNLQQPRFPAFALRIKIGAGVSGVPIFDPPQPQGPLSRGAPCRKHKHMSRRGRPKTKCGECAVCRNSKSKKKCGPTRLAPQSQDGFPSPHSAALRSCLSRALSLSRAWPTPPAPPQRRSLPRPPQPNAPLLQVHRGSSARAGAAEAAQGGSAVSGLAWPRICAAKARRNRHGFALRCRAVQRRPQAQVVPQREGSARRSRRGDVRHSPVRVWQGERPHAPPPTPPPPAPPPAAAPHRTALCRAAL
jgi:hypothetical protein